MADKDWDGHIGEKEDGKQEDGEKKRGFENFTCE